MVRPPEDSESGSYERPQQNWVCGHAGGVGCSLGPSGWGVCRAGAECEPVKRNGEWICNRSMLRGGKCDSGPTGEGKCGCHVDRCTPRTSLRRQRGTLALVAVVTGIGIWLCAVGTRREVPWVKPGELTHAHSVILAETSQEQRCIFCHDVTPSELGLTSNSKLSSEVALTAGQQSTTAGQQSTIAARGHDELQGLSQSQRCLRCHDRQIAKDLASNPHSMDLEQLAEKAVAAQQSLRRSAHDDPSVAAAPAMTASAETAAAETAAAETHPVATTNPSTPVDPESAVPSLGDQPTDVADARNLLTRLGHMHQLECSQCHREHHGADHDLMAMTQQQCNVCHASSFTSFADHPEFDPVATLGAGVIKFNHATHASQHFGQKQVAFECESCHIQGSDSQVVATVDFGTGCAQCHRDPIEASLAGGLPVISLPMLDVAALREAKLPVGDWPELATGDFDGRLPPLMVALLAADNELNEVWKRFNYSLDLMDVDPADSEDLALMQQLAWGIKRLVGELAEEGPPALRRRLEASLQRPVSDSTWRRITATMTASTFRDLRDRWFQTLDEELAQQAASVPAAAQRSAVTSVAGTPVDSADVKAQTASAEAAAGHVIAAAYRSAAEEASPTAPASTRPPLPASSVQPTEDWPSGGWYRDDETLVLSYLARGHADDFLAGWYQLLQEVGDKHGPSVKYLKRAWLHPNKVGQCISCHQLDLTQSRSVVWSASKNQSTASWSLTRFNHAPHLTQRALRGCVSCHELSTLANVGALPASALSNAAGPVGAAEPWLAAPHHVGLEPITKAACASCHHAQAAGDQCTKCHTYHVRP